jgi:hypothetical protein
MLCCLTFPTPNRDSVPRRVSFHVGNLASHIRIPVSVVAQLSEHSPRHCQLCDKEARPGEDTLSFFNAAARLADPAAHRTQPPRDPDLTPSLQLHALPSLLKHGPLA